MSCKCSQIGSMKKKKHKVGAGSMDGVLSEVLHGALPGAGMVLSHEVKAMLPDTLADTLGVNAPYIINGIGIVAGLGLPLLLEGDAKAYAKAIGSGFAGQCIYSMYLGYRGQTAVKGADNNAYALAKTKQMQLKRHLKVAGADNNANALAGMLPKGDSNGLYGMDTTPHQRGYGGRVSAGL